MSAPPSPAPRSVESLIEEAVEQHRRGALAEALALYRRVLARAPRNPRAWFGIGSVNAQLGRPEPAIHQLERAMALDGPRPEHHHNIAGAKSALGRFAEAETHLREAVRLSRRYAEAWYNLAGVRRFRESDGLHLELEALLREGPWSAEELSFLHFAAAKVHDDIGHHDAAFGHYAHANAVTAARFDPAQWAARVAATVEICDADFVAAGAAPEGADGRFAFIVGMPRSGTSLVEQILAAHPRVFGAGELPDVGAIAGTLPRHAARGEPYPQCLRALPGGVLEGFGRAYAQRVSGLQPGAQRYLDKLPLNFQHLGLIVRMLPGARILHCRRDVLDTCLSCWFQRFRSGQEYSFRFEDLAAFYAGYLRLMAHWRVVLPPGRMLELDYERLVREPEAGSRALTDFLGIEWHERCRRFERTRRAVHTASKWQVRQPLYTTSVGRARQYRRHLGPLIEALARHGVEVPAP